jgi:hypothetical protein
MNMTQTERITLYYREGSSDKVYQASASGTPTSAPKRSWRQASAYSNTCPSLAP